MSWVVRHTRQPLNDLSHTLQGPQVIGVAVGFGPSGHFDFDDAQLVAVCGMDLDSPDVRLGLQIAFRIRRSSASIGGPP